MRLVLCSFMVVLATVVLAACDEEALVHPPMPPAMRLDDLTASGPASRPSSASAPVDEPPLQAPQTKRVADAIPKTSLTMETLMEDYLEPLARKAFKQRGRQQELDDLLRQVGDMMPADDPKFAAAVPPKTWQAIVDNALKGPQPKYGQSCKQCHALWKKPYKKSFHKREVEVVLPAATP